MCDFARSQSKVGNAKCVKCALPECSGASGETGLQRGPQTFRQFGCPFLDLLNDRVVLGPVHVQSMEQRRVIHPSVACGVHEQLVIQHVKETSSHILLFKLSEPSTKGKRVLIPATKANTTSEIRYRLR